METKKLLGFAVLSALLFCAPAFAQFDGPPGDDQGGGPEFDDPGSDEDPGDSCDSAIDGETVAYAVGDKCDCDESLNKYKACLNKYGKAVRTGLRRIAKLMDDDSLVSDYDTAKLDLIDECELLLEEGDGDPSEEDL